MQLSFFCWSSFGEFLFLMFGSFPQFLFVFYATFAQFLWLVSPHFPEGNAGKQIIPSRAIGLFPGNASHAAAIAAATQLYPCVLLLCAR